MRKIRLFLVHAFYGIYRPRVFGRCIPPLLRAVTILAPGMIGAIVFRATGHIAVGRIFLWFFLFTSLIEFGYFHFWPARWNELSERQKFDEPREGLLEKYQDEWLAIQNRHEDWKCKNQSNDNKARNIIRNLQAGGRV